MSMLGIFDKMDRDYPLFSWYKLEGSTEAINFQVGSSFAKELTELMQEVLDFANEHDMTHGEVTNNNEALIKHTRIRTFIEQTTTPNLKKTVLSHTGIEVAEIISLMPISTDHATAIFCQLTSTNKILNEVLNAASGHGDHELDATKSSDLARLLDFSYSLDRNVGKILSDVKKLKVKIGIPIGIFCLKDFIPNGEKYQFSASEIAATILHEIGHVFSWIEYMADLSYSGYYGNNQIRSVADKFKKDPNKLIDDAIVLADNIEKLSEKDTRFKNFLKFTQKARTFLIEAKDVSVNDPIKPKTTDKLTYKSHIIGMIVMTLVKLIIGIFMFINFIGSTIGLLIAKIALSSSIQYNTSREFGTNTKNLTMYERLADEYVSRFKMSKDLNNALMKLEEIHTQMVHLGFGEPVFNSTIRDSYAIRILVTAMSSPWNIIMAISTELFSDISSYEDTHVRLKRNISNLIDTLKTSRLPQEIRNEIVADIEEMDHQLKNVSMVVPHMTAKIIRGIFKLPVSAVTGIVANTFGNSKIELEYLNLFETLDRLLSNRSHFYAAKIRNIFED